ncbi:hypothetical protein [Vulcanococcus limneticus]|nr:hypothetical protein [Vulcanococcus limneticus]
MPHPRAAAPDGPRLGYCISRLDLLSAQAEDLLEERVLEASAGR